jgi:signal transduction histidine kinase/DNA-binding response OmpR family regulator/CHASE3 domain sensor protein
MKSLIIKIFEMNIKTILVFIFIVIALICTGFAIITESLFSDIKRHKEQYLYSKQVLLETNNLVSDFYSIQEYGKLFLMQKEDNYLYIYQAQIDSFQYKLENILQFIQHNKEKNTYLNDVTDLLIEKKEILIKLQELFVNKKEVDSLYKKITEKIENEINRETEKIASNPKLFQDTVWQDQKTFAQRLKDAFIPNKKRPNNITTVTALQVNDSIYKQTFVVTSLLDSLYGLLQQYQNQYNEKIRNIEFELYALLDADEFITKKITDLLLQLHDEMLLNIVSFGEEYEKNVRQALGRSIIEGTIGLLLIAIFFMLILRNIKTIRRTHEALAMEKQKTEELLTNRHKLLLAITHDIKTPLNSLLGYLELWENELLTPAQLQKLNTMQYSGKYILTLLNNLLEFSRLEQQKAQITKDNIEIVPFIMEILEMFQPLCNERKNKLHYNINMGINPQIVTDALKLKQIIVNLISNAVKFTSKGDITVNAETICEPELRLVISVSDTGKGIPEDKKDSLFVPFSKIDNSPSGVENTGLGLCVVKGLIDLMKGTIEIETEENKGTSVTIIIPFESVFEKNELSISHNKSLKIWVIEDDATQLQVIISMLQKMGHTAFPCTSKESFENTLETKDKCFDVVFTDLKMGDMNGYDVLKRINSIYNIPVICVSGSVTVSKTELLEKGFYNFLEKPFSFNQLEKILNSIHRQQKDYFPDLLSLETLNELFGNDKETISELLNSFSISLPGDIQRIEHALAGENLFLLQQTTHKLLPFCKQINATEVIPILEKIEISKKEAYILFADLETDVISLITNLKKLLKEIQYLLLK